MGSVLHEAVVLRGIFPCCQVLVEKAASALRLRLFAYCWYVHNNRDGVDFASCDDGSFSMRNLPSLLQMASLFTNVTTASLKTIVLKNDSVGEFDFHTEVSIRSDSSQPSFLNSPTLSARMESLCGLFSSEVYPPLSVW